jgi:hypothetical protein
MYKCKSRGAFAFGAPSCIRGYMTSCKSTKESKESSLTFGHALQCSFILYTPNLARNMVASFLWTLISTACVLILVFLLQELPVQVHGT